MLKTVNIDVNICEDDKIKEMLKDPDGYAFFYLWIKIICLSENDLVPGFLYNSFIEPYTHEELSYDLSIPQQMVSIGLALFEELEMIRTVDGVIEIVNFNKWQRML